MHLLLLALMLTNDPPEMIGTRYVLADVLRLRMSPQLESDEVARLRINTRLALINVVGEWSHVRVEELEGADGWAQSRLLRGEPLTVDEALGQMATTTGEERVTWAERLVALDGAKRAHWAALEKAYAAGGRTDKVRWAKQVLAGRAPGLLAVCRDGQAVLLAHFDGDGKIGGAGEITALPWYVVGRGAPRLLAGTVFSKTTTVESRDGGQALTSLGACEGESFFSTAPLRFVRPNESDGRVHALRNAHPRREGMDGNSNLSESGDVFLGSAFGGKLLLRVADWHYTWSQCEEGTENCGSEDSTGLVVGGTAQPGQASALEILLSSSGC